MFDSENEINQKLGNCIVLKDQRPFFVVGAHNRSSLLGVFKDGAREEARVSLTDPTLDIKNLGERLGYVNVGNIGRRVSKESYYLMRQPIRRSIQGLHDNNIYISPARNPDTELQRFTFHSIYMDSGEELSRTMKGLYPSVREIRGMFSRNSDLFSMAFDRHWAIERNKVDVGPAFNVVYKMNKVGYSEDLEKLRIAQKYKFLSKDLRNIQEAMSA